MNKPTTDELLATIQKVSSDLYNLQDEVEIRKLNKSYVSKELERAISELDKFRDFFKVDCI